MKNPTTTADKASDSVQQFVADGFVKLEEAFPRALGEQCRGELWRATGCDPRDPRTWTRPVIRLGDFGTPPFRFPGEDDPGDDRWHVEASYTGAAGEYRLDLRSRERALLMLFLFSDVGEDAWPAQPPLRSRAPLDLRADRLTPVARAVVDGLRGRVGPDATRRVRGLEQ